MNCPGCKSQVPSDAQFCPKCGLSLAPVCSQCQTANSPGDAFCKRCGHALAEVSTGHDPDARFSRPQAYTPKHLAERIIGSKAALEGERKRVSVLFADLKGSMELLSERDPEEARKLLDPVLERMIEAVHRYEGTVNQVMGDGIMALFGAPLAHEDHAVRACYAALRMQDAVSRYAEDLRRKNGVDAQIRVGLNTGEVVVRSIGSDLRMDYTAVGQSTHLAARMEQLARPGTTLMTEATLHEAEGYVQVKPIGPTPIKGVIEPILVYELIGIGAARTRLQASAGRGLTGFVGRDAEVEQLRQALEQAAHGRGQVIAVMGEAGVGKSRLFYEFVHSHRTQGWLVLESDAVTYGKATPYLPLVELLKSYFKLASGDDARAIRAKVTGNVLTLDERLKDSIPALLWLLDALPEGHEFLALEPSQKRDSGVDAAKRVLLRESATRPLLLVIEDLHWIDAETQRVLDALVEGLPTAPVLLAVNYRPEYQHSWGRKTYYRQLRIDPLPPEGAEALLALLLGDDPSLERLRRMLIERTEGNPLFLEESVRSLVETGVLVGERGAYRFNKDSMTIRVPATVQAILAARIDRLPPDDKELLQTASVVGKDVPWALLLEVAGMGEGDLRRALARLQGAELVYEAKLFPDLEYTFKHALTHEVAYGSLLQDRRRALHAKIAEGIERVYADRLAEHSDRLAHHVFRGEVWHKALRYFRQTGLPAPQQSIDALKISLGVAGTVDIPWWRGEYERAVTLARRDQTVGAAFGNFGLIVGANFRLGQAYHSLGEYARAVEVLERNVTLLEGDLRLEMFELAGLPSVFSRTWLALCLAVQGRFDAAAAHAEQAVVIAETANHAFSIAIAYLGIGTIYGEHGDYAKAIGFFERGFATSDESDIALSFPLIAAPLGWIYARAGRYDEGLGLLHDAVQRAEAMEFAANHALRHIWLAEVYLLNGDNDAAKRYTLRALELAQRHSERGHQAYGLKLLGELAMLGSVPDVEQAAEHYRAALTLAQTLGMQPLAAAVASCLP